MNATCQHDGFLSVPEQRPAQLALEGFVGRISDPSYDGGTFDAHSRLVFLHGPSGGGKSRLVQWLIDQLADAPATIIRLDADANFQSERSTRGGAPRVEPDDEPDLLIVENVQFLAPNSVETFLERLDQRQAHDLPTVLTASAGPRHLRFRGQPYPARLTSRLAAGLVVAVPLPQPASRRVVIDQLLHDAHLDVPEVVIAQLANQCGSFRALEGAVHQLKLLAHLDPGPLRAEPLLDHFQKQTPVDRTSVERIVQRVAGHFQVAAKDIRSRSRRRGFVVPRHVSMYLARQLTPLSFQQIGVYFGGCDHATVLHACRKMERTLADDPQLGGTVRQLHDEFV